MDLKKLHWKFLLSHWIITLLISPFLIDLMLYMTHNTNKIGGLLDVYIFVLFFSIIFSIPTYIVSGIIDYICLRNNVKPKEIKSTLIIVILFGILITFLSVFQTKDIEITFGYFFTSLISGLILKLK